jgi:hypothetical protein
LRAHNVFVFFVQRSFTGKELVQKRWNKQIRFRIRAYILLKFEATTKENMVRLHILFRIFFPIKLYLIVLLVVLINIGWHPYYSGIPIEMNAAYPVSKSDFPCNCTLDFVDNAVGFELPNVKIIKSEHMQSQTEGNLEWNDSKQLAMDGVLVDGVYLANQSAGALTDLNTIRAANNQLFTIEVSGGSTPRLIKTEIVNLTDASLNNTSLGLGSLIIDEKQSDNILQYGGSAGALATHDNSFYVKVPKPGDYVLILSLGYQDAAGISDVSLPQTTDLTAIYKAVLSVQG